jgi:MFS family permease
MNNDRNCRASQNNCQYTGDSKSLSGASGRIFPLYLAAFMQETALTTWFLAMPLILVKTLEAQDTTAGLCMGLYMIAYVVTCIAVAPVLHRYSDKRLAQLGTASITVMAAVMCLVVALHSGGVWSFMPARLLTAAFTVAGMSMAFVWPCLMGWVSHGHEGPSLSRRLGRYNMAWSGAGVVGPLIGGILVKAGPIWPLAGAACFTSLAFVFVGLAGYDRRETTADNKQLAAQKITPSPSLGRFRWTSRIALLSAYVCVGTILTQLPLRLNLDLGFSEPVCGSVVTSMCLAGWISFFLAGRLPQWHYNLPLFACAQLVLLVSVTLIATTRALGGFYVWCVLIGLTQAFVFSSHMFYGVSGGRKRSGLMAIHELILASGLATGSVVGGTLSDHIDREAPYWFCGAVVLSGLLAQAIVYFSIKPSPSSGGDAGQSHTG